MSPRPVSAGICSTLLALLVIASQAQPAPAQDLPAPGPAATKSPENEAPPLRGLAQFGNVQASASDVTLRIMPDCRMKGYQCVKLKVVNNMSEPVTVDGDHVTTSVGGRTVQPVSAEMLEKDNNCGMTAAQIGLVAVVGVGSLGLAGPMLAEKFEKPKYPQSPFTRDATRWKVEGQRFGRRWILPGDDTEGWLCFQCAPGEVTGSLVLPVYGRAGSGQVTVSVSAAGASR